MIKYSHNFIILQVASLYIVAINKNTLPETLALLGEEPYDFGIKYFVAHNPNTPKEVREQLKGFLPQNTWPQTPSVETLYDYYDRW